MWFTIWFPITGKFHVSAFWGPFFCRLSFPPDLQVSGGSLSTGQSPTEAYSWLTAVRSRDVRTKQAWSLNVSAFTSSMFIGFHIFSNCSFFWNPFELANLRTLKKLLANANEPTTWRPAEASVELRRFTSFPSPAGVFDSCGISNFTLKLDTWFQSLGSSHYSYEKNCSNTFDFEKG